MSTEEGIHPDINKTPNCSNGWKDGSCCCNCVHQHALHKHPWNKDIGKGPCSETMGWVCAVKYDGEESPLHVTFSDHQHSFCELHYPTPERDLYVKRKAAAIKFGLNDKPKLSLAITPAGKHAIYQKWKEAGMFTSDLPEIPPHLMPKMPK